MASFASLSALASKSRMVATHADAVSLAHAVFKEAKLSCWGAHVLVHCMQAVGAVSEEHGTAIAASGLDGGSIDVTGSDEVAEAESAGAELLSPPPLPPSHARKRVQSEDGLLSSAESSYGSDALQDSMEDPSRVDMLSIGLPPAGSSGSFSGLSQSVEGRGRSVSAANSAGRSTGGRDGGVAPASVVGTDGAIRPVAREVWARCGREVELLFVPSRASQVLRVLRRARGFLLSRILEEIDEALL